MIRTLSSFFVLILLSTGLISCGGYSRPKTTNRSGLTFRAFVSNPVSPGPNGGGFPALNVIDAKKDLISPFVIPLFGTIGSAGMMIETPKRDRTLVLSPAGNSGNSSIAIVDNATESASSSVTLPGSTESMFVAADNNTLYAAMPAAPIAGLPAGAVVQVNLNNAAITATIPLPGARFVVPTPSGNQILVISDTADTVTVISPALISTGSALTTVSGVFDNPVWAVFSSDGSTAYVMNCGPECGGFAAGIVTVDMTTTPPQASLPVPVSGGATTGLLSGGNLYVAGTLPLPGTDCQANLCGTLTVFPGANLLAPTSFPITDGYHDRLVMAPNNQLFIGSHTCSNVIAGPSIPGRGCLSVFNTGGNTVYTAAQNGDVTGIQPISNRAVVYVCEDGILTIYDTALDLGNQRQLQPQKTQVTISGQVVDVKQVDF
ncbi:MAG: hypothetical protein DMG92_08235 [Acidobacteria bacterium]|nr:MAG: hypothetical protein DMG92_08235 [Acidobacteriota bacterium]